MQLALVHGLRKGKQKGNWLAKEEVTAPALRVALTDYFSAAHINSMFTRRFYLLSG